MMSRYRLFTIPSVLVLLFYFQSKAQSIKESSLEVPILCGAFESIDSSSILSQLTLSGWNRADWSSSYDDMLYLLYEGIDENTPLRPSSKYFIRRDTLFLEMDKGYFVYTFKGQDTLFNVGPWDKGEIMVRVPTDEIDCPTSHTLDSTEQVWLENTQMYYKGYYSTDFEKGMALIEKACKNGYGPACMTFGLNVFFKDKEKGMQLIEKSCEMGYFGNYACFKLGEMYQQAENVEAAKKAYLKACEGGHLVGCGAAKLFSK